VRFTVLVPARFASSRFPGKALELIDGKPMVVRVCEQAALSGAAAVHVATDDLRIAGAVREWNHSALMTRADHPSGTDRIAEAASQLGFGDGEIVVNVQGDEPLIDPALIASVARELEKHAQASMSTACHAIDDPDLLSNPNVVKVVLDAQRRALYFSRSQIPFPRQPGGVWYRHAGIYGYRVGFLRKYLQLAPSPLERTEALEQLRVLWHGYRIAVFIAEGQPEQSVDTPEDLILARRDFTRK
jgi:3-deoxy-manno-octulosonate cytidylyltransferase (CMP-KDO synthetase)